MLDIKLEQIKQSLATQEGIPLRDLADHANCYVNGNYCPHSAARRQKRFQLSAQFTDLPSFSAMFSEVCRKSRKKNACTRKKRHALLL